MCGKLHIALPLFLLSLLWVPSAAQESLGIFNSVKGIGATVRFPDNGSYFHTATGFIDIYGVATSRCSNPGLRFNVSRQYILKTVEKGDIFMTFYSGPGITAGYVRDHDKGLGIHLDSLLGDNEGAVVAISGDVGCRFDFGGIVALDLSFASDLGVHIRRNENEREYFSPSLSIYNNGWMQWLYPQFTILFRLR